MPMTTEGALRTTRQLRFAEMPGFGIASPLLPTGVASEGALEALSDALQGPLGSGDLDEVLEVRCCSL